MRQIYNVEDERLLLELWFWNKTGRSLREDVDGEQRQLLGELREGEYAVVRVVVGGLVDRRTYLGCPYCRRRLRSGQCPEHGAVEAQRYEWKTYYGGDESWTGKIEFPPAFTGEDFTGKTLIVRGRMRIWQDELRFVVDRVIRVEQVILPEERPIVDELRRGGLTLEELEARLRNIGMSLTVFIKKYGNYIVEENGVYRWVSGSG